MRCFYQNGIKSVVWRVKIKEERDHLFFQALSVDGWILAFRLDVHRLCVAIEEKLGHFLSRWLKMGSQSVVSRGKIPWNNPPWSGFKPVPRRGQTMRYILSPTELSWPGPRRGQTMRYILPLLIYNDIKWYWHKLPNWLKLVHRILLFGFRYVSHECISCPILVFKMHLIYFKIIKLLDDCASQVIPCFGRLETPVLLRL